MSPHLPDAAMSLTPMELLFRSFHLMYGNKVNTMWGEVDPDEVHSMWTKTLSRYSPADWDDALNACLEQYPDYPPTLPQFALLCRNAKLRRMESPSLKLPAPRIPMPEHIRKMLREYVEKHRMPS